MMKVLFINELFGTRRQGGQEIASMHIITGLKQKNVDIEERNLSGANGTMKVDVPLPRLVLESPYIREMIGLPIAGHYFMKGVKDIALIHATSPSLFAFTKVKYPLLLTIHGIKSEKALRLRTMKFVYRVLFNPITIWLLKATERRGLQKATNVIVLTERTRDYIVNSLGIEENKIKLIPNGVNTDQFTYNLNDRAPAIFVGRATPPKGIELLLTAVREYSLPLIIVTSRISKEHLAEAKRLGVTVHLNVPNSKLVKLYHQASLFILPSYDEEQPLTVLEAMACGLPIVTTAIGSGGVVQHNSNGLIIRPEADEIATAIYALLNDSQRLQVYSKASRTIAEKHSWSHVVKQYLKLYESLTFKGSERM